MRNKEEQDVVETLRRNNETVFIRNGFEIELEEKLVQRFKGKNKNRLLMPGLATTATFLFFLFIVFNQNLFEGFQSSNRTEQPLVYIYHTHTQESFFPELDKKDEENPGSAHDKDVNISLVGQHLSSILENNEVPVLHDKTDFLKIIQQQNLEFMDSYSVSRENVKNALNNFESIKMVFDIHRDSARREVTTTSINDEEVATLLFSLSQDHPNYQENLKFAKEMNDLLEERYPGLTRGVFSKDNFGWNDNKSYNQDLLDTSVLINIGGVDNTLQEVNRTAEYLAEIIIEMLKRES
ncbi:stage II sporulation protein P [Alkalihalobacillus sp. 1P02AB]|uniref:stage II sporulation protein P n=1 Tax=Alkalihalobacillus sp. 1P02AB TaxID=3132260 RepID=UPI0039A6F45D